MLATCPPDALAHFLDSVTEPMLVADVAPNGGIGVICAANTLFSNLEISPLALADAVRRVAAGRVPVLTSLPTHGVAATGGLRVIVTPLLDARMSVARVSVTLVTPGERMDVAGAAPQPASGPLLLLVEDNPPNQLYALSILRHAGYRVDLVTDGPQAVTAAEHRDYAAILMDIQLPTLNGIEATALIRRLPSPRRAVPVIAITAHALPEVKQACIDAGMNDFITKPVGRVELLSRLGRWIPDGVENSPAALLRIEEDRLSDLLDTVQPSEWGPIVACFLDDIRQRIHRIELAAERADLEVLAREAHDLSSTAGSFGAVGIMEQATQLEIISRQGKLDESLLLVRPLPDAVSGLVAFIERRFGNILPPQA